MDADVKLARQMYELASHREEGWLTDYEKKIIKQLGVIPTLKQARENYQFVLLMQSVKEDERKFKPTKYKKEWMSYYRRFADMYNRQKVMGMTEETDAFLCEWALSHKVPKRAVMMTSHHSRHWLDDKVKNNDSLYFGHEVLVKN